MKNKFRKIDHILWAVFLAGAAIGISIQFYFHKFLNIDTLAYINIAELYADGNFGRALIGCWSPLYSWIIAFFLKFGIPAFATCYVLNFVAAAGCYFFLNKLARRFITNKVLYFVFHVYIIFTLMFHSLSALTPDLLGAALGFWLVNLLMSEKYFISRKLTIVAGIIAGFMYFAKAYNFIFCTVFFPILIFWKLVSKTARKSRQYVPLLHSLMVFLAVSLLWITPISIREGRFTISTASGSVRKYVHPEGFRHPASNQIVPPPFEEAYSAWTDPVQTVEGNDWSPFESKEYFLHQLNIIWTSLSTWLTVVDPLRLKSILLLICLMVLLIWDKQKLKTVFDKMKIPLLVIFLYPLGYLPIFIIERYLFLSTLLFHLFLFYVLQEVLIGIGTKYIIVVLALVISIGIFPFARVAKNMYMDRLNEYRTYKIFYNNLDQFNFLRGRRIFSDHSCHLISAQLCYWVKCRFYGIWNGNEFQKASRYQLEYFLSKDVLSEPYFQKAAVVNLGKENIYVYMFNPDLKGAPTQLLYRDQGIHPVSPATVQLLP